VFNRYPESPGDKITAQIPAEKASLSEIQCKILISTSAQR